MVIQVLFLFSFYRKQCLLRNLWRVIPYARAVVVAAQRSDNNYRYSERTELTARSATYTMRTRATVAFGSSRIYFFIQLINQVRDTDNAGNREASVTVYCTDNRFCNIFSIVQWNYDTAEPGQKYDLQYITRILLLYNNTDTIFENSWISIIYYTNIPRKQFTPSSPAHRANNIQNLFLYLILYQHNTQYYIIIKIL